jgi:hypothetical protein
MCGWVEMKNERYYVVVAKRICFGGHVKWNSVRKWKMVNEVNKWPKDSKTMIPIAVVAHFIQECCMLVAQVLAQVVHRSLVPRSSTNYSSKTCSKPSANGELKYLPTPTFLINFPTNFILYIYQKEICWSYMWKGNCGLEVVYSIMLIFFSMSYKLPKRNFIIQEKNE